MSNGGVRCVCFSVIPCYDLGFLMDSQSFGEVRQILRMPNGDLVVSFQSAEVADTVCRVRAKVFINGVGSVQLSWTTEKKR